EDVQALEEFRPPSAPRIAVEGLREAPGAREGRGLLAYQVTGSESSVGAAERRGNHHGQNCGRVPFDRHLLRGLLHFAPRDPLPYPCPAQAAIPFRGRRDVDGVVEPPSKLVPPDRVVLGHAASAHHGARFLRLEDEFGEVRLVPELVDRELLVPLPKRPELIPDRPVEHRRNDHGDTVLPRPPQERLAAPGAPAKLPEQFACARPPGAGIPT